MVLLCRMLRREADGQKPGAASAYEYQAGVYGALECGGCVGQALVSGIAGELAFSCIIPGNENSNTTVQGTVSKLARNAAFNALRPPRSGCSRRRSIEDEVREILRNAVWNDAAVTEALHLEERSRDRQRDETYICGG